MTASDDAAQPPEFLQDVAVDKPGIVGARWWHQGLKDEGRSVTRRQALIAIAAAGGVMAAFSTLSVGVSLLSTSPEATSLQKRPSLDMQKAYGWDFGARGVPLVFNGVAEGPFVRPSLSRLAGVMTPSARNARYHIPTLIESLTAAPASALPDPEDGLARPDAGAFRRLADVIVPIVTPEMQQAYAAGEALARLSEGKLDVAALADMPGHQAVAFAAGAASVFEPVALFDNWPHPHGVVASHLPLAALAYYQPRFESQKAARPPAAPPLFMLDRMRLAPYSEESDRFDNRYYARVPKLETLASDNVNTLLYVVTSPAALPEPEDVNPILAASGPVQVQAVALTDFRADRRSSNPATVHYGGSAASHSTFWSGGASSSTAGEHRFTPRGSQAPPPSNLGKVAVVATASGLVLAAALDRRGSMNRFAGGWSG